MEPSLGSLPRAKMSRLFAAQRPAIYCCRPCQRCSGAREPQLGGAPARSAPARSCAAGLTWALLAALHPIINQMRPPAGMIGRLGHEGEPQTPRKQRLRPSHARNYRLRKRAQPN